MEKYPDRIQNKYSQTKKRTYPMNVCEHCGNGQGWYYIYKDANEKIQGMKEIDVFTEWTYAQRGKSSGILWNFG